ncbi:hypothetical protein BJX65DRAFT_304492 [Aspergillus insuetus]
MATTLPHPFSDPTIGIVHGAWHNPTHYSGLTTSLQALGHEVLIRTLPFMNGTRPPTADLHTDTEHIRNYVKSIERRRPQYYYINALLWRLGWNKCISRAWRDQSTESKSSWWGSAAGIHVRARPGRGVIHVQDRCSCRAATVLARCAHYREDRMVEYRHFRDEMIGPRFAEAEVEAYGAALKSRNRKDMYQKLRAAAWRDISVSYMVTMWDGLFHLAYQTAMIEGMRAAGREVERFEWETGHCPHVTTTKGVMEIMHTIMCREAK